jgi:hypothetical protein
MWSNVVSYISTNGWYIEDKLKYALVSKYSKKTIFNAINWEVGFAYRFGEETVSTIHKTFQNCDQIMALPSSYWEKQYIERYIAAVLDKCSYCRQSDGVFKAIGLQFCLPCWDREVLSEDVAEQMLKMGISEEKLNAYHDMDIILLPSILIGATHYYLKLDVITFIEILGGTSKVSLPEDAFNRTWRKDLQNMLVQKGLDWERAGTISHHVFPPDGMTLAQVANQIIDLSLDDTHIIEENENENRKEKNDEDEKDIVEEIVTECSDMEDVCEKKKKEKAQPNQKEEYTFTQNFFDGLEKKHESLAHDNNEEAFDPDDNSHSDEESNNEMEIDNHYSNIKKSINNYDFPKDFFFSNGNKQQ